MKPIYASWMISDNFGDKLAPWLIEAWTGRRPVFVDLEREDVPKLLMSSSILNHARPGDTAWGCGLASNTDEVRAGVNIPLVRGPLTRQIASKFGVTARQTYGDPTLLVPSIMPPMHKEWRNYGVGVIPHYVDQYECHHRDEYRDNSIDIIDILAPVDEVIDRVRECEGVVTSTLHGLILADAYGIPAVWAKMSDRVGGDDLKFRDWIAATGRGDAQPLDLRDGLIGYKALIEAVDAWPEAQNIEKMRENVRKTNPIPGCTI